MVANITGAPSSLTANVLLNDHDNESQNLTVSSWGTPSPSGGTLSTNSNGIFTYTPALNFTGDVTFTYSVCDTCNVCSTGTVTIHVLPCITPPPAPGNVIMHKNE
jgi:hypothetical protein